MRIRRGWQDRARMSRLAGAVRRRELALAQDSIERLSDDPCFMGLIEFGGKEVWWAGYDRLGLPSVPVPNVEWKCDRKLEWEVARICTIVGWAIWTFKSGGQPFATGNLEHSGGVVLSPGDRLTVEPRSMMISL